MSSPQSDIGRAWTAGTSGGGYPRPLHEGMRSWPWQGTKAMIVCDKREIAYQLLRYSGINIPNGSRWGKPGRYIDNEEEPRSSARCQPWPWWRAGKNKTDMYNYLGGVNNDKRSEKPDAFKQEKSNFRIVIVVDMWITDLMWSRWPTSTTTSLCRSTRWYRPSAV